MAATTIYDVMIRFGVTDKKAKKKIRGLGSASDKAYGAMKRLAVLAGAGMGMRALVKHTVGYNAMLQETRDSLTTVIQGLQKISEGSALQKAGDLMENLRGDAKKSAGTFQEMTEFAKAIAPAVLKAGGSIEDLRDMTKGGAVAAAAFGERADVAARDIKDALRRGVNARDPFASQLLATVGMTADAFNKLDTAARLETLKKAFRQPAILAAAKRYETSFTGAFSTFKSNLQEFMGKVGAKLFIRLSKELRKVNSWFEKNQDKVADFAKELADDMVTAFNAAKKIFGFLFQHRDLLMTLAKAMLIAKAGNFMAGPFLAFNKNLGESALALDSNVKGLKGFGAALGPAIQTLTAGLALGTVIDKAFGLSDSISDTLSGYEKGPRKIENKHGDSLEGKIRNQLDQQKENFRVINSKLAEARKKDKWVAGFGGKRLKEGEMGKAEAKVMEKYKGDFEILENTQKHLAAVMKAKSEKEMQDYLGGLFDMHADFLKRAEKSNSVSTGYNTGDGSLLFRNIPKSTDEGTPKNKGGRQTINVHMEVASDDPDRFVISLEDYFERANTNPSQASNPMRK